MRSFFSWVLGLAAIAAVAFLAVRMMAPCSLPAGLPGAKDACEAKLARIEAAKPVVPLPPMISVVVSAKRQFHDRQFVSGTLVARDEALVGPQIEGLRTIEVLAEDGDAVTAGQVLARLDRSQLEALAAQSDAALARSDATISQVSSQIEQAQATRAQAEADSERAQRLDGKVLSQAAVDQRATALKVAQAQLDAAQNALNVAKADKAAREAERRELNLRLSRTDVKAPVSGTVSRRTAKVGAMASGAADAMFRVITDGAIDLDAEVPADRMPRLAVGMKATITLAGSQKAIPGHVRLISEEVDKSTRTGKVRIALTDDPAVRVGSFATAIVEIEEREGLGVPASSLQQSGSSWIVQTVVNERIETRKVQLGITQGDDVEIREGLAAGDQVVARAAAFLRPGDLVRVKVLETPAKTALR